MSNDLQITLRQAFSSAARQRVHQVTGEKKFAPDRVICTVTRFGRVEALAEFANAQQARGYLRRCGYPSDAEVVSIAN